MVVMTNSRVAPSPNFSSARLDKGDQHAAFDLSPLQVRDRNLVRRLGHRNLPSTDLGTMNPPPQPVKYKQRKRCCVDSHYRHRRADVCLWPKAEVAGRPS